MAERMKVLIAYDGSKHADAALDDLLRAGLPREGEALVVSVSEVMSVPTTSAAEVAGAAVTSRRVMSAVARAQAQSSQSLAESQKLAAAAGRRLRSHLPGWEVRAEALAGTPSWELIQKAAGWGADLVVVGSQGRTAPGRLLLGSVSKKVAVEAPCSVRVARRREEERDGAPPRIIIGVDGSSEAERAVRAVGERVWPEGTQVRIVAVDDGTSPTSIARVLPAEATMIAGHNEESAVHGRSMVEWAEGELRAIGLDASFALLEGDPRRLLVEYARKWGADCIFVGSRRFTGTLERLRLGSVSTALVTRAHCSVEVVRPRML